MPLQLDFLVGEAVAEASKTIARSPGRNADAGPLEETELAPAVKSCLAERLRRDGVRSRVELNYRLPISNWSRGETECDLVALAGDDVLLVAELKVWDIGHQLFDLAKVACLLSDIAPAGYLICVAYRATDFDRKPGGELFPALVGDRREHRLLELIEHHRAEWEFHVGRGGPEPTSIPTCVETVGIASGAEVAAYPGQEIRAARVLISDPSPIALLDGVPGDDRTTAVVSATDLFYDEETSLAEKRRRLTELADAGDTEARGYLESVARLEMLRHRRSAG